MGLNIGGYNDEPNWPKMGPSLLIATCLIVAIRTAKWTLRSEGSTASDFDLEREIENAAHVAGRVLRSSSPESLTLFASEESVVSAAWRRST